MKMIKVLVTLLVAAGLVLPVVAVAEDKLSISGEFRVMGYSYDNYKDFDDKTDADDQDFFGQRLRLYSKYAVTEGVSIHTRMDFGETQWGVEGQNSVRYTHVGPDDEEFQLDRAFLEIKKGAFNIRAGQQYYGFGNSIAVDHQGTGFRVAYGGPVSVTGVWNKLDEGDSLNDDSVAGDKSNKDTDFYAGSVKYKNDAFAAELFYGIIDDKATDLEKSVIGLAASTQLGPVALNGEFNYFDGDDGAAVKTDYVGTQLFLEGKMAAMDALTVGAQLYYAQGTDKTDEAQLSEISDFGSWLPWEHGYLETDFGYGSYGTPFNAFGQNAGTISALVFADFVATDDIGFKASIQYGTEEEDKLAEYDYMSYNVSAQYKIADNTFVQIQGNMLDRDLEIAGVDQPDDTATGVVARLIANF